MGLDVLVEKPLARECRGADALLAAAKSIVRFAGGHVERFNRPLLRSSPFSRPLFLKFPMGVFTPRSLDVDVNFRSDDFTIWNFAGVGTTGDGSKAVAFGADG